MIMLLNLLKKYTKLAAFEKTWLCLKFLSLFRQGDEIEISTPVLEEWGYSQTIMNIHLSPW